MKPIFAWLCKDMEGLHLFTYEPESYMYESITPIIYFEVEMLK